MQPRWNLLVATCFMVTALASSIETMHMQDNQLSSNDVHNNRKLFRMGKKFSLSDLQLDDYMDEDAKYLSTLTFTFNCTNRPIGFYADVEYNCTVFHMCNKQHERVPHMCSNGSSFNQQYRICDWKYNFKCNDSEMWYFLNEKLYLDGYRQKYEDIGGADSPEYDIDIK